MGSSEVGRDGQTWISQHREPRFCQVPGPRLKKPGLLHLARVAAAVAFAATQVGLHLTLSFEQDLFSKTPLLLQVQRWSD